MEILKDEILAQIAVAEQDASDETKISRCVLLGSHLLIKERLYDIRDKIIKITQKFCFCFVELQRIRMKRLKQIYFQNGIIITFKSKISNQFAFKKFKEADFLQYKNMDKFDGSFLIKWFISENDFNNSIDDYNKYFGVEKSRSFFVRINENIKDKNLTIGRYNLKIRKKSDKCETRELLDAFMESRPEYSLNIPIKRKGIFYYYMIIKRMIKCSDVFRELLLLFKAHFNVKFKEDLTEDDWLRYKSQNSIKNYYHANDLIPNYILDKNAEEEKDKKKIFVFKKRFPYLKNFHFLYKEYFHENEFINKKFWQVDFFLKNTFDRLKFKLKLTNGNVEILKNTETKIIIPTLRIKKKISIIKRILNSKHKKAPNYNRLTMFCRFINYYFFIKDVKNVFYNTLKVYMCKIFDEDVCLKYFNLIFEKCKDYIFTLKINGKRVIRITNAFCVDNICKIMCNKLKKMY